MIKFMNKLRSHLYKNDEIHKVGGPGPPAWHEMEEIRKIDEVALPSHPLPNQMINFVNFMKKSHP